MHPRFRPKLLLLVGGGPGNRFWDSPIARPLPTLQMRCVFWMGMCHASNSRLERGRLIFSKPHLSSAHRLGAKRKNGRPLLENHTSLLFPALCVLRVSPSSALKTCQPSKVIPETDQQFFIKTLKTVPSFLRLSPVFRISTVFPLRDRNIG